MRVKCVRGHTFRCRHRSQALRPFPRGPVVSSIKAIRLDSDPVTGEALEVPMGRQMMNCYWRSEDEAARRR
jgi:hypothetical protein